MRRSLHGAFLLVRDGVNRSNGLHDPQPAAASPASPVAAVLAAPGRPKPLTAPSGGSERKRAWGLMSMAPGRPKPLTAPSGGSERKRAWGLMSVARSRRFVTPAQDIEELRGAPPGPRGVSRADLRRLIDASTCGRRHDTMPRCSEQSAVGAVAEAAMTFRRHAVRLSPARRRTGRTIVPPCRRDDSERRPTTNRMHR
jgi:hypothetical protein